VPFDLVKKEQLRQMMAGLLSGVPSPNGQAPRTALLDDGSKVYPWDSVAAIHVKQIASRADFGNLRQDGQRAVGLICGDARDLRAVADGSVDLVITDPPFGDNVNYSELSDFFYVWLAPILKGRFLDARGNDLFDHWEEEMMPKDRAEKDGVGFTEDATLPPGFVRRRRLLQTPKQAEIIESRASQQTKTARDYNDSLRAAFAEAHRKLKPNGIMAFTFHHNDVRAWWAVVAALLECVPPGQQGFHLEAVYPIVGEAESTTHHHEKQNATFDIIHVCRKRTALPTQIKWAMFRRKVREAVRRKREELLSIPAYNPQEGGYVSRNDLRMILLGVGFQLYSEHYGQVEFPKDFLRQAQAAPRGRRGKRTVAEAAAQLLFEEARQDMRRTSDPADDPSARNLCELTYAIDEILDEIEHEQANPLPPELESLAGEVDRISRFYFKYLLPEHGRTIKYDDLKQLEYRTGVAVKDLTDADVLTTRHRNREYEIKRPSERYRRLRERFLDERPPLGIVDRAHFLIDAIDDAAWAERNKVEPVRIDEFLVEGKPMDEAWTDQKDQLIAAIRMIAAHTPDEETKVACGRALKWLAPAVDLFTPGTAKVTAGEGNT
jgi:tRNA G10  N-methylase Trm11